jgi:hypothetical protein
MKKRLSDPKFIIPVKADAVAHSDAPPELIREHMLMHIPISTIAYRISFRP